MSVGRGRLQDEETHSATTEPTESPEHRTVYINKEQPIKYMSNAITTAKYNFFSFLPKFLFEQFRRYSNIFFLFIALLQQIPDVSPTGKYTTLTPLVCILTISAVKEFIEDWKRHRADDEVNNRQVEVLDQNNWQWKKWSEVMVGDVCKIRSDQFFPADLVLLSSSEPQSLCYIETANLDGETNLKIRQGLPQTAKQTTRDLDRLSASVECELPNRALYEFVGTLRETGKQPIPLGPDQLLLRGAKLRNTTWVFGTVVYSGHETKLMKNSSPAPLKRSTVDKRTNSQILLLFTVLVVLCLISAIASELWTKRHLSTDWYLGLDEVSTVNFGYNLLTFIILYNNLIPISLQVTVEIARFIQALYINMDREMYYEPTDTPAMARTSNLNEELGQVKYVLTDKTGTLTQNVMEFQKCSIAGVKYDSAQALAEVLKGRDPKVQEGDVLMDFLIMMSCCHTVIPEREQSLPDSPIVYHAASPDERALVEGARRLGYTFTTRTPDTVSVEAQGQLLQFQVLNVLEFTSTRKRMSVIIRRPSGRIQLMCKGADTVIYERLGDPRYKDQTLGHLTDFASEGLRTLCLAMADISEEEYKEWNETYQKAATAIHCREEKIEDAARLIETNLVLLGATAIEDKLQDKVPETIESLLAADIHVWVLTGDKQETAINIGHSSRLLHSKTPLLVLNEDSLDRTRDVITQRLSEMEGHREEAGQVGVVIDGHTLQYALSHELRSDFMDLCLGCQSVICCRVSPGQKAEITELVTQRTGAVTLAIGDGANDVAMIQSAHVGVGIAGVEGLQAAHASDYAIGQFRFLTRLLFVHGAWNYSRLTRVILYSFYKNICLYVIELWYAIYSGWSGQVVFERWTIAAYNLIFTSIPPLIMGFIDRTCSDETRLKYPQLYKTSQEGQLFNVKVFWLWIINSLVHSVMLFWLSYGAMTQDVAWSNGKDGGYLMLGNMVYTYVVVTVSLKAGLEMNAWTWLTHLAIWGSILVWFLFLIAYSRMPFASDMLGLDTMLLSSPVFWMGLILVPTITMLPDFSVKCIWNTTCKSLTEEVRESEIRSQDPSPVLARDSRQKLTETARLLRNVKNVFRRTTTRVDLEVELAHGYAFSQEEGGAIPQGAIIRAYDTTRPKPTGM